MKNLLVNLYQKSSSVLSHSAVLTLIVFLFCLCIGEAWGENETATLTFTAKCNGAGTDDKSHSWTIVSDASESTYDASKGIHYGTNDVTVSYVDISTTAISYTVSQVVVYASRGSNTASISVSVGGTAFKCNNNTTVSLSDTNTGYTFTGSASGTVLVHLYKGSATKKAIYCKSVAVTYSAGSTKTLVLLGIGFWVG